MSAGRRRLSLSLALALCVGVAYFGLLDALIGVRRAFVVGVQIVRNVAYEGLLIECPISPEPRPRPFPVKAHLPPETPPIEIEYWDVSFPAEAELIEFDPTDIVTLG